MLRSTCPNPKMWLILSDNAYHNQVKDVQVLNHIETSDHYPILFRADFKGSLVNKSANSRKTVRHYRDIDQETFQADLVEIVSNNLTPAPDSFSQAINL